MAIGHGFPTSGGRIIRLMGVGHAERSRRSAFQHTDYLYSYHLSTLGISCPNLDWCWFQHIYLSRDCSNSTNEIWQKLMYQILSSRCFQQYDFMQIDSQYHYVLVDKRQRWCKICLSSSPAQCLDMAQAIANECRTQLNTPLRCSPVEDTHEHLAMLLFQSTNPQHLAWESIRNSCASWRFPLLVMILCSFHHHKLQTNSFSQDATMMILILNMTLLFPFHHNNAIRIAFNFRGCCAGWSILP